jgi:hypothetical protein
VTARPQRGSELLLTGEESEMCTLAIVIPLCGENDNMHACTHARTHTHTHTDVIITEEGALKIHQQHHIVGRDAYHQPQAG